MGQLEEFFDLQQVGDGHDAMMPCFLSLGARERPALGTLREVQHEKSYECVHDSIDGGCAVLQIMAQTWVEVI